MKGSTVDAMSGKQDRLIPQNFISLKHRPCAATDAVERAAVMLCGYSLAYKESANCRYARRRAEQPADEKCLLLLVIILYTHL